MSNPAIHNLYTEVVRQIRKRLGDANVGYFQFSIEASGRTQTGEDSIGIIYELSGEYGDGRVTGDSPDAVVEEYLRRKGWKDRHEPLRLA